MDRYRATVARQATEDDEQSLCWIGRTQKAAAANAKNLSDVD
ncbi:MAG: hypothetical protein ACPG8W_04700 [Candidatus Promineifilaceae bacterium]